MNAARSPSAPGLATEGEPAAPPVVAVVVTCDPGWWLEDCLASLAAQDYPDLSVLVIDADSREDPTPRVASVMPMAYVRRVHRRRGFGLGANEVVGVVEGASHYVFCHDDVALEPSAVRLLIEEAYRSNAAIVAPKVSDWFAPDRLLAVGMGADRFGVPVALVERGELDQQQHDGVRDVFFAPSPCSLIRADLFATLGGFDTALGLVGEDLDLSWRAHLAGARVVVAPQARVRHLEATETGQRGLDGVLRATGPDARAQAAQRGMIAGAFEEDADAALVATPDVGAAEALARVADDLDLAPAPSPEVWDLRRWDEEDDAQQSAVVADRGRHHRRHVRLDEEDLGGWRGGGDEDWEVPISRSGRRRSRGAALEEGPRPAPTAVAGPRVPVAAVLPVVERGPEADVLDERRAEARLLTIATDYSAIRAACRLLVLLVVSLFEATIAVTRRGRAAAHQIMQPWGVLLRESGRIRAKRKTIRSARTVGDRSVALLQVGGLVRARQAVRTSVAGDPTTGRPPELDADRRLAILGWVVVLAVLGYGSRRLLIGHLPTLGDQLPMPSLATLWRLATSGWRTTGLGKAAAAPAAFVLLALGGTVLLGHTTLLQHVLLLGLAPIGLIGVWRLGRWLGSSRAATVAMVAYAANPLPYNAISTAQWTLLAGYAALPWVVGLLVRGAGLAPFDRPVPVAPGVRPARPFLEPARRVLGVAVVAALAGALAPGLLPVVGLVAVALALGLAVSGARDRAGPVVLIGVAGAVGGAVLLFPWSTTWLPPAGEWATFTGQASGSAVRFATLLRFQTGTLGAGPLGYALLVAAAFPLVVGREWRLAWAMRLWVVALASFALAWAGQHQALGFVWPAAPLLLAPAAVALALTIGLGVVAFDVDLAGYRFGWRQMASAVAVVATVLACAPVLALAVNGRWRQPQTGFDNVLSWMAPQSPGDFRVLWLGQPGVLPLPGWRAGPGLAYATSLDGTADASDLWPASSDGPTRLLDQAVTLVREGRTSDVGHLLAPMGVRYVVVVDRASPLDETTSDIRSAPPDLGAGLDSQLDLEAVDRTDALTVYLNDAWAPLRFVVPAPAVASARLDDPRAARSVDLSSGTAVLGKVDGPTTFSGALPAGVTVEVAAAPSGHWQLRVGGRDATRSAAWVSSQLFSVAGGGRATLRYRTPVGWRLALVLEVVVWVAALVVIGRRRPVLSGDRAGVVVSRA